MLEFVGVSKTKTPMQENNPNNPMGNLETQNNPKKQIKLNKSKLISKDINLRLCASSAGSPEGRPAPKLKCCE